MIKNNLIIFAMVIALVGLSTSGQAAQLNHERQNTFVGNGGNAGDLELQMTIGQLKRITQKLAEASANEGADNFCQCPAPYVGRPLCEPIKAMESNQSKFCVKILPEKANEIQKLISSDGGVKFDWSEGPMSVIEGDGAREAHAVANRDAKRIVINREYFVDLTPQERVFLVAHELLHFTQVDGHYLKDDAPVKYFSERDGGRKLINGLSSSVAAYGVINGSYAQDRSAHRRSKNYADNWFTMTLGSGSGEKSSTFAAEKRSGGSLEYGRRFSESLGLFVRGTSSNNEQKILSSTTITAQQTGAAVGLNYRIMPFKNPASYWGQSFINLSLGAEYLNTKYKLNDTFVSVEDEATSLSTLLRTQYFIPVVKGFWALAEISATHHKYALEKINVESASFQGQFYLGVGYGF